MSSVDTSISCVPYGNADMYGLGIRLGFYLQWFAGILANLLFVKDEISASRFTLASFIAATFVALVVQTAHASLSSIDIYIICLMSFGSHYFLVPTFLWRMVTCFSARLDPTRWSVVSYSTIHLLFSSVLLASTTGYQLWFWISGVYKFDTGCHEVGFLFTRLPLKSQSLRSVNIAFLSLLALISIIGPIQHMVQKESQYLEAETVYIQKARGRGLQYLRSFIAILVAVAIIAATELSILWNNITGINSLDSAGQLIPFVLGIAIVLHVPWAKRFGHIGSPIGSETVDNDSTVGPVPRRFKGYAVDPPLSTSYPISSPQQPHDRTIGPW